MSTPEEQVDETEEIPDETWEEFSRAQREGRVKRGTVDVHTSDLLVEEGPEQRTGVRRKPKLS